MQRETNERVELSLFADLYLIFALRRQTKRQTFSSTLAGRHLPLVQTAGGRAMMAHLPDEEVEDILARSAAIPLETIPTTPKTDNDPDRIRALVHQARQDGYAMAFEESLLGELNAATAILDHRHRPVAAIQIAGLTSEWNTPEEFGRRYSPLLMTAARALSGKVGLA
jgi:DNA-binding IclR family transcriptional regulator